MKAPTIIETNVPFPKSNARTELGRIMSTIKPGQSFETTTNVNTVHSHARYYGIRVAYRTVEKGKIRVWRLEEKPVKQNQKKNQNENRD